MAIAAPPQTYPFSVYTFTTGEIDQIVTLVGEWSGGRILPIDQRHYTKKVLAYAEAWRLLDRQGKKLLPGEGRFSPCYDLPAEALWRLVAPMLQGQRSRGRSITRDAAWLTLNIWPESDRHASATSVQEQLAVLDQLAGHGYLRVQMAGSIWEITTLQEKAYGKIL